MNLLPTILTSHSNTTVTSTDQECILPHSSFSSESQQHYENKQRKNITSTGQQATNNIEPLFLNLTSITSTNILPTIISTTSDLGEQYIIGSSNNSSSSNNYNNNSLDNRQTKWISTSTFATNNWLDQPNNFALKSQFYQVNDDQCSAFASNLFIDDFEKLFSEPILGTIENNNNNQVIKVPQLPKKIKLEHSSEQSILPLDEIADFDYLDPCLVDSYSSLSDSLNECFQFPMTINQTTMISDDINLFLDFEEDELSKMNNSNLWTSVNSDLELNNGSSSKMYGE